MKNFFLVFLLLCLMTMAACGSKTDTSISEERKQPETPVITATTEPKDTPVEADDVSDDVSVPANDEEVFTLFIESWKSRGVDAVYDYCSEDIKNLVNLEGFAKGLFCVNDVFGEINDFSDIKCVDENSMKIYTCNALFENVEADLEVVISNKTIMGYNCEMDFITPFEYSPADGITERYFSIDTGKYELNAVYTDSGKENAPSVLLIPGSGPSDYNETAGLLVPFEEIARKLAGNGINSLRMEKRTERFAADFLPTDGMEKEYFEDFGNAYEWLAEKDGKENVYLLGHSLGSQIAIELADRYDVSGLVLMNGTPRHLADVLCDQYINLDPGNKESYLYLAELAKAATKENAVGAYYYGATDNYWASYNELNPVDTLKKLDIPTLIINSHSDAQIFETDIEEWKKEFTNRGKVSIAIIDDINHFGYVGAISGTSDIYKPLPFSDELVDTVVGFIEKFVEQNE